MRRGPLLSVLGLLAVAAACSARDASAPASPCAAFPKAGEPALRVDGVVATHRGSPIVALVTGAGRSYALDRDGGFGLASAERGIDTAAVDVAVGRSAAGVRAYAARWSAPAPTPTFELVRFTSADDGLTFDAASAKVLFQVKGLRAVAEATALSLGPDGRLYVALGDAYPDAGAAPSLLGKILRLDVSNDDAQPEVWAVGVHEPRGLDVDASGDAWLTDRTKTDDAVVLRVTRGSPEPVTPVLYLTSAEQRPAAAGGHVHRGTSPPSLVGKYVYVAQNGRLGVVTPFGPSGPAQASVLELGAAGPLGRGDQGDLAVVTSAGIGAVSDAALRPAPTSLLATGCWDPLAPAGLPVGVIPYDVTTPLWSDGATKQRFVALPEGARLTARADGDLLLPVGTVAVKTFAVDGRRVETRLLVQHDVEDWVGYSYAWNEAQTDATLVVGDRTAALAGGKSWYFPSTGDCAACHTPAAGYTLGLEARQLLGHGDALARLEDGLPSPIDHGALAKLVPVDAPPPATAEQRARSYLHANCSSCHREGSATGTTVELDLRLETPLAATGLCGEPNAGTLGIDKARLVAPREPARSVLLARMRSLDERRMPKLASRVVDEAGAAAVEAWIRDLASCP
ncbi:MAG TPA: hypothetical protein VLT33_17290 [Labilithrix sp.]|nr:hypothetical protein [Labilithrix sp.]